MSAILASSLVARAARSRWLPHGAGCHRAPNAASIALHEKFGMRQVGHFKAVGHKFGNWQDVGNWQRLL